MGLRGPKPTPTAMLRLVGSRKANQRLDEPRPRVSAPTVPAWLSVVAKAEWKRIVAQLVKIGVIAQIDRAALAAYCQSWADYETATKAIRREGLIVTTPRGDIKKNPMVSVMNESRSAILRFSQEFGLTPSARARIVAKPKGKEDPLSEFVKRKNG